MDDSTSEISTKLVEKVRLMYKKPSLDSDISAVLEECLKKLEQQTLYLENGICNINLGEIAIVIEQVSLIYGKKVDLLWQYLLDYQKRLLRFNTQIAKIEEGEQQLEERSRKYKRKRKKKVVEKKKHKPIHLDWKRINAKLSIKFDEKCLDDELTLKHKVTEYFSRFPKDPENDPVDRYTRQLFVPSSYPVIMDEEYICDTGQVLTHYYQFEISDFLRQTKFNFFDDRDIGATGIDLRDEIAQKFITEKNLTLDKMTKEQYKELDDYIELGLQEKSPLRKISKRLCPRRSSILLTRLSDDVIQKYLKKDQSSSQSLNDSGFIDYDSDTGADSGAAIENTASVSGQIPTLPLETSQIIGSEAECSASDPNSNNAEQNNPQENGKNKDDSQNTEGIQANSRDDNVETQADNNPALNKTTEEVVIENQSSKRGKKGEKTTEAVDRPKRERQKTKRLISWMEEMEEEIPIKKIRPDKSATRLKLRKVITKTLKEYETFHYKNYVPEEGEGTLQEPVFPEVATELDSSENQILSQDSGFCDDLPVFDDSVENEVTVETTVANVEATNVESTNTNNTQSIPGCSTDSDAKFIPQWGTKIQDTRLEEQFRVQQIALEKFMGWKLDVEKRLARSDKKDFDIHEYGTRVLDMLPNEEPVKLTKVMQGKKASEVARLFAASLQLTNTSNIELQGFTQGVLANDSLEMRLISRDRYHEHLDTYQAPSLENRVEALKRIKAMKRCQPSTSKRTHVAIPHKKRKH